MAKIKIIYFSLLWFFVCGSAAGQGAVKDISCTSFTALTKARACVKRVYDSQVGVREVGGANRGTQVEEYLRVTGLGPGYSWCAAFVSWCYLYAGVDAPVSAWVPTFSRSDDVIYKRGLPAKATPKTGDVFMIWYDHLKRPAHIGFVDEWSSNYVITVEGNTNDNGSRNGDGVYRKRRLIRQVWAVSRFIDD